MTDSPLPHDDQLVTMVTVRDGHIFVASSTVLVSKANSVALSIDTSITAPPEFSRGQDVTLLYASGDRVMRLKATIQETVAADRITLRPAGAPREGDRRDYRRADVKASVFALPCGSSDLAVARAAQMERSVSEDQFQDCDINLSGSGVMVPSTEDWESETLLDLRMKLPMPGDDVIRVLGRVVRTFPTDTEGKYTVAVRFAEITETDQDRVVYTVFSRYFQSEGLEDDVVDLTV